MLPTADEIAQLRAHPRFSEAVHSSSSGLIEMYQGNRVFNAMLNDRARVQMGFFSLYLYWSRKGDAPSGLTIGRLKEICVEGNFCSPGRVEGMVALMRVFGYARLESDPRDQRVKLIIPTDKLIQTHLRRWRRQFAAMTLAIPEAAHWVEAMDGGGEFAPAFLRHLCERYIAGFRVLDAVPEVAPFIDRNSGWLILLNLLVRSGAHGRMTEPSVITVNLSRMSRRFGVSRSHARKLLGDAEEAGFIRQSGRDKSEVAVLPFMADRIETALAILFITMSQCAREALADIADPGPRRSSSSRMPATT